MIYEIIDSIIECFGYPFNVGMPNFGDDEPELYIVYTLWEAPDFYGDGEYLAAKYTISLHFFCDIMHFSECRRVEKQIKKKLLENDFVYIGSQTPSYGADEPQQRHIIYEFTKILESEE